MLVKKKQNKDILENQKHFVEAALSIFHQMSEQSFSTHNGIFWESISNHGGPDKMIVEIREDLYAGNAGMILYLLELFRITKRKDVKELMNRAIDWLVYFCDHNEPESFAFYTGRSGVAYVFLKIYGVFKEERHLEAARRYLSQSNDMFRKNPGVLGDDLINGSAGLLLVNLHMYNYTNDANYTENIKYIVSNLIIRINYGKAGVYWNRLRNQISGLCGLSHGAAGVSWVLAEIGHHFNDHFLNGIAQQAVCYENLFFERNNGNWLDLRMDVDPDSLLNEHINVYKQKINSNVTIFPSMHAWCHGAAGIGLVRYRLYELTGSKKIFKTGKGGASINNGFLRSGDTKKSYLHAMPWHRWKCLRIDSTF